MPVIGTLREVSTVLMLVACPECEATAEITDSFRLYSTDGPVEHLAMSCVEGHHFRMPADELTEPRHRVGSSAPQRPVWAAGGWAGGRP